MGDVNKHFVFKSLWTTPSNVLPLHLEQTFPLIIWIFIESEGDGIESRLLFKIFSTLPTIRTKCLYFFFQNCNTLHHVDWWDSLWTKNKKKALSPWHYKYSGSSSLYVCLLEIGGQSKRWFAMNALSILWETNGFILKDFLKSSLHYLAKKSKFCRYLDVVVFFYGCSQKQLFRCRERHDSHSILFL